MAERFEIGDEVNIRFDKSIVTGVRRWKGGCAITVQTADTEFSLDVDAVDTTVRKLTTPPVANRCGARGFAGPVPGCIRRAGHEGGHGYVDGSGEQDVRDAAP